MKEFIYFAFFKKQYWNISFFPKEQFILQRLNTKGRNWPFFWYSILLAPNHHGAERSTGIEGLFHLRNSTIVSVPNSTGPWKTFSNFTHWHSLFLCFTLAVKCELTFKLALKLILRNSWQHWQFSCLGRAHPLLHSSSPTLIPSISYWILIIHLLYV